MRIWLSAVCVSCLFAATADAASLVAQATKLERQVVNMSADQAHIAAIDAIASGNDALGIAAAARSVGLSVKELERYAQRIGSEQASVYRSSSPRPSAAPITTHYSDTAGYGYDGSFDAPSTPRQVQQNNVELAQSLYQLAINTRNLAQRRELLQQAAELGHEKARQELQFY